MYELLLLYKFFLKAKELLPLEYIDFKVASSSLYEVIELVIPRREKEHKNTKIIAMNLSFLFLNKEAIKSFLLLNDSFILLVTFIFCNSELTSIEVFKEYFLISPSIISINPSPYLSADSLSWLTTNTNLSLLASFKYSNTFLNSHYPKHL